MSREITFIKNWVAKLNDSKGKGGQAAVARRCGVSESTITRIVNGSYGADGDKILSQILYRLHYRPDGWTVLESISNYRQVAVTLADARNDAMWFGIANKAGSGKTCALQDLYQRDTTGAVTYLQAEEWSARQFIIELAKQTIGEPKGAYKSIPVIIEKIAEYYNCLFLQKPVILIDEGDKLKPAALRSLISLFNKTEDRLGLVISGTENLEKEIKRGVKYSKKGYDEIDSRLGRVFTYLRGATYEEVLEICRVNGIEDENTRVAIWDELEKTSKETIVKTKSGKTRSMMIEYVEDFRIIKRVVKRQLLMQRA